MRRRLFTFLSVVSLVLCLVTAFVWAGGYAWNPSDVWREAKPLTETRRAVGFGAGTLHFDLLTPAADPPPQDHAGWFGFGYAHCAAYAAPVGGGPMVRIGDARVTFVPLWFIVLLTAALPLYRLGSAARGRFAARPGHCRSCGYDLRATPDRCPECGTVTAAIYMSN